MVVELGHDRGYLVSSPKGPFRWNRRFLTLPWRAPIGVVSPGYYGFLDEFPLWNAIFTLYYREKLEGAAELMSRVGIGMYGDYAIAGDIIWLEANTSDSSEITRVREHLEVEMVPDEVGDGFQEILDFSARCYDEVSSRFGGLAPRVETLITYLAAGSEIPTILWRDGYVAPKAEYGKICLSPFELEELTETRLKRGLVHWFAFALSGGLAAAWLLEATTAILGQTFTTGMAMPGFRDMETALVAPADSEDGEALRLVERARAHAQAIGTRLLARGGIEALVRCLASHRGPGELQSTRGAIRRTYGVDPDDFFLD